MTSKEQIDNTGKLVCVTGAGGFIGTHVVRELLERGYRVRATLRDANDEGKSAHLYKLAEDTSGSLEIFSANLLTEGSFDEAISGCDYVCHVASAVAMTAKDPQKEIVDVALNGTKNVFESIARASSVKKVILTSSIAAILGNNKPNHIYTEKDWNEDATLKTSPYPLSKTLAEKFAWEFHKKLPEENRFDLISINPCLVLGPVYTKIHARSSPTVIKDLLTGKFPACPNFRFSLVDVREVADAHVNALETNSAQGRYLLYHEGKWMQEISAVIRKEYPQSKAPYKVFPNWLMYIFSIFDKRLTFSFLKRNLGIVVQADASKAAKDLGIQHRSIEESIKDTCQSFIDNGFIALPKR